MLCKKMKPIVLVFMRLTVWRRSVGVNAPEKMTKPGSTLGGKCRPYARCSGHHKKVGSADREGRQCKNKKDHVLNDTAPCLAA